MFETGTILLNRLQASARRSAKEAAEQLTILAEFARLDASDFTHLEVAAVLKVTERHARNRLDLALALTTRLPKTLAALRAGDIDEYKAKRIKLTTDVLSDQLAAQLEDDLIPKLVDASPRQLNDRLRRAVITADPAGAAVRTKAKHEARRIIHENLDDGAGLLFIQGDAERTRLAYNRVRALAKKLNTTDESRTLDQIMSDVALDCLAGKEFDNAKVNVWLTLPATTALGVDDKPALLAGYGWLTAQRALTLAAKNDATWRRILTDPATGHAVDAGRNTYAPPAALRDHIKATTPTCTGPGCVRPAHTCDQDHVVPFPEGETSEENLHPACRTHHNAKTHHGWRVERTATGLTWITKHGFRFPYTPTPIADPEPSSTEIDSESTQAA
jgi:hypothetical protein